MGSRLRFFILIYFCFLFANISFAQEHLTEHTLKLNEGSKSETAKIEEVAWIAGHWSGEALGGWCEEVWSEPKAGTMMGMFRLLRDEKTSFFEILTIIEEDSTLVLRLKHFHPNLKGWEEKDETVDFPLVKVIDQMAYFSGITFHRKSENELIIYLAFKQKDGSFREGTFHYKDLK